MSDSPIQTVLQQREARPVSGEHLEVLGKKAASDWVLGKYASLNEAVVSAVHSEQLSPEQVRRVVEFCNGDAYLQEFRKEGSHRVVHFDKGPADPAQVLQDLNDGGGGSLFDRGTLDYGMSPKHAHARALELSPGLDKTASANEAPGVDLPKLKKLPELPKLGSALECHDADLWALFGEPSLGIPFADPLQPLMEVNDKLAGMRDTVASEVDSLENAFGTKADELYEYVKQAALDGTSLGEVVSAWSTVNTDPVYVKVAFAHFTPKMQRDQLFPSMEAIGQSLMKTAHRQVGAVNPEHPLVAGYADFIETFDKLAGMRALQEDLASGAAEASELLKDAAAGGLLGAAKKGLGAASGAIDSASPGIARALVGAKDAKKLAPALSTGLKATGVVGGALVGNAALQSVTDRPGVRAGLGAAKSVVPGTMEYQQRRYNNMTGQ